MRALETKAIDVGFIKDILSVDTEEDLVKIKANGKLKCQTKIAIQGNWFLFAYCCKRIF